MKLRKQHIIARGYLYEKKYVVFYFCFYTLFILTAPVNAQQPTGNGTESNPYTLNINTITNGNYIGLTVSGGNLLTFTTGANNLHYRINGGLSINRRIVVNPGVTVNITLNGVNINTSTGSALHISPGSTVNLTILGSNTLTTTAAGKAGIYVPGISLSTGVTNNAALNISGGCVFCKNQTPMVNSCVDSVTCLPCAGYVPSSAIRGCINNSPCVLTVSGGNGQGNQEGGGAGIGGNGLFPGNANESRNSGHITIHSGIIDATGGTIGNPNSGGGAGIGGGGGGGSSGGNVVGDIIVEGGKITAAGGGTGTANNSGGGSGIGGGGGGGNPGHGGNIAGVIIINEGYIIANGGATGNINTGAGAGIGGGGAGHNSGVGGSNGANIIINGGLIHASGGTGSAVPGAGIGGGGGVGNSGGSGGNIFIDPAACVAGGTGGGGIQPNGRITVTYPPQRTIVVAEGNITEGLLAAANAVRQPANASITLEFQWYYKINNNTVNLTSAISVPTDTAATRHTGYLNGTGTCNIPTGLVAGNDYYFFCHVISKSSAGAILDQQFSNLVRVIVYPYTINYVDELLEGLEAGEQYTLGGYINPPITVTATGGKITIDEDWMGETITIYRMTDPADAIYHLAIPARPSAPTGIGSTKVIICDGTVYIPGTLTNVTNDMEYKLSDNTVWTRVNTAPTVNTLTVAGIYDVRYAAVQNIKFASVTLSVIVDSETFNAVIPEPVNHINNNSF